MIAGSLTKLLDALNSSIDMIKYVGFLRTKLAGASIIEGDKIFTPDPCIIYCFTVEGDLDTSHTLENTD